MIRFGPETLTDLAASSAREWIETNGIGGYASSTIAGVNTRRYHGLLVAAVRPPVGRMVLLSKMEETLVAGDARYDLSVNRYPGVVHPAGHRYLAGFRQDPFPVWTYRAADIEIDKSVFCIQGENTVVIEYAVRSAGPRAAPLALELRPLIAFRDFHSLTHANAVLRGDYDEAPGRVTVRPYDPLPSLSFAHNASQVVKTGHWYHNFQYEAEQERGLDFEEDLFQPFALLYDLSRGGATVIASCDPRDAGDAPRLRAAARLRRPPLHAAADQFLAARGELKTVMAGYHWFGDWGRDTMISLPGLTLATGRPDAAREILLAFSRHVSQGMLPNRFPDAGEEPEYNTVDAALWFFEAVRAYLAHTGDGAFAAGITPVLAGIVEWHTRGTRYGIRVDSDGLLRAGEPGVQLTWMDAKVGDWVVTPRHGKPVEIQALWYNALRVMDGLRPGGPYAEMAARARESFGGQFWNAEEGCLYDVVDGPAKDGSIRPNQIFAVGLHHPILEGDRARSVVDVVRRELLTPYGLRTLSPRDSRYVGTYEGGVRQRDGSYHQGTVWPWLLGAFIDAWRRVHGGSPDFTSALMRHWREDAGLGQISEIFDGDPPHRPRGCIAQAWSLAELLRVGVTLPEDAPAGRPETSA